MKEKARIVYYPKVEEAEEVIRYLKSHDILSNRHYDNLKNGFTIYHNPYSSVEHKYVFSSPTTDEKAFLQRDCNIHFHPKTFEEFKQNFRELFGGFSLEDYNEELALEEMFN